MGTSCSVTVKITVISHNIGHFHYDVFTNIGMVKTTLCTVTCNTETQTTKRNKNKIQAVGMKFLGSSEENKRRDRIRNLCLEEKLEIRILQGKQACAMTQNKMNQPVTRRHQHEKKEHRKWKELGDFSSIDPCK